MVFSSKALFCHNTAFHRTKMSQFADLTPEKKSQFDPPAADMLAERDQSRAADRSFVIEDTDVKALMPEDVEKMFDGPSLSESPVEETVEHRNWNWAVIFLCFYGFMASVKPGEPFITPYLLSPEKNFTRQQVCRSCFIHSFVFVEESKTFAVVFNGDHESAVMSTD